MNRTFVFIVILLIANSSFAFRLGDWESESPSFRDEPYQPYHKRSDFRKKIAEIINHGGTVRGPTVVCTTYDSYHQYQDFLSDFGGSTKKPSTNKCWSIEKGEKIDLLKIKNPKKFCSLNGYCTIKDGRRDIKFPFFDNDYHICYEGQCKFSKGWFGKDFWLDIQEVKPLKKR